MEDGEEKDSTEDCVRFWNLSTLLERVEDWIFRELLGMIRARERSKTRIRGEKIAKYLLIELVDVEAGLVLGLNDNGVLLHLLRGRHLGAKKEKKWISKRRKTAKKGR